PENMMKLANDWALWTKSNTEEDTAEYATLAPFIICFLNYAQIIRYFANPSSRDELQAALMEYLGSLMELYRQNIWKSIKSYHWAFMNARINTCQDDPEAWRTPNTKLVSRILVKMEALNKKNTRGEQKGAKDTKKDGFGKCFKFNNGEACGGY
ncbi:MAG: hypothetical protein Q9167_008144, partial [Letrouitia subvulpina]